MSEKIVRMFHMMRDVDPTGTSGTGFVAECAVFADGTAVMHWSGLTNAVGVTSSAIYSSLEDAIRVHGHDGATRFVEVHGAPIAEWMDVQARIQQAQRDARIAVVKQLNREGVRRGLSCAFQDDMENAPFGSVGGLAKRRALESPSWINDDQRADFLEGYRLGAEILYGSDWLSAEFTWSPALTIKGKP